MLKLSHLAVPFMSLAFVAASVSSVQAEDSPQFFSSYEGISSQQDCFAPPFDDAEVLRTVAAETSFTPWNQNFDRLFSDRFFAARQSQTECLRFTYDVDGVEVPGFMVRPANSYEDTPVLVFHRGGNGSFGAINFVNLYARYMGMVGEGYTIIGSNLRAEDEFGGADVDDARAILSIVQGMDNVDHDRIALWGSSRGATQMMQVARGRDDIHALVFEMGAADHEQSLVTRPEMIEVYENRVPDFDENREQAMKDRSVVYWADELPQVPVLILHGEQDERVDVEQAHLLAAALDESGHEYELKIYPEAGHSLMRIADEDMFSWLGEVLNR
ncbi:alpha/beta hydrolase family protein [Aliidiomarina minuta]|nr:prolyl oligopeptidase family serine peptidase [Aliidiomarina minuta]